MVISRARVEITPCRSNPSAARHRKIPKPRPSRRSICKRARLRSKTPATCISLDAAIRRFLSPLLVCPRKTVLPRFDKIPFPSRNPHAPATWCHQATTTDTVGVEPSPLRCPARARPPENSLPRAGSLPTSRNSRRNGNEPPRSPHPGLQDRRGGIYLPPPPARVPIGHHAHAGRRAHYPVHPLRPPRRQGQGQDDVRVRLSPVRRNVSVPPAEVTGVGERAGRRGRVVKNIECCSHHPGRPSQHSHIKVVPEEKPKRKLFH